MKVHTVRRAHAPASNAATSTDDADPGRGHSTWFLAYDIREPARLRRVHRCVRREGVALQYSGFAIGADAQRMQRLLDNLESIIQTSADDVRAYHLPAQCKVWSLGRQSWPGDVTLTGAGALGQLLAATSSAEGAETAALPASATGTMDAD